MSKKILITGGPGTGKTALISKLISDGFIGFEEKSREIISSYKKKGIDQLFLTNPLLFSDLLLESRINQYLDSVKIENENVFFDRGIPDIVAYLDFKHMKYNQKYIDACENHKYDLVFILRPWKEIFVNDKQRYESFEESLEIDKFIYKTYKNLKYNIVEIPKISIKERMNFIIDKINII
ncbi:ATP-binding protein [Flavobacteriaceae bacterium]|jgi:predicted ATPase|nr:ATP-binding protein [Flavobacteriaceae bacterium]MDC1492290.1 ATP-binding protein [Flavobacteriaceae bacterium]